MKEETYKLTKGKSKGRRCFKISWKNISVVSTRPRFVLSSTLPFREWLCYITGFLDVCRMAMVAFISVDKRKCFSKSSKFLLAQRGWCKLGHISYTLTVAREEPGSDWFRPWFLNQWEENGWKEREWDCHHYQAPFLGSDLGLGSHT